MARIQLIDIDLIMNKRFKAFPNLALMKLSAWHKAQGDEVFLNMPLAGGSKTYISSVFTWNVHKARKRGLIPAGEYGGSGFGPDAYSWVLPPEIEHIRPDYSLYGIDYSVGYMTRGCVRDCPFCIVHAKEGGIQPWSPLSEFLAPGHTAVKILDNNPLAAPNRMEILEDLAAAKIWVDFNQGLDIRLVDEAIVQVLLRVKVDRYRFAFDDLALETTVRRGVKLFLDAGISPSRLSFYVLAGFEEKDTSVARMRILGDLGVRVFPMIYRDEYGQEPARIETDWDGTIYWHGPRPNIIKFLRLCGRDFIHKKTKGGIRNGRIR